MCQSLFNWVLKGKSTDYQRQFYVYFFCILVYIVIAFLCIHSLVWIWEYLPYYSGVFEALTFIIVSHFMITMSIWSYTSAILKPPGREPDRSSELSEHQAQQIKEQSQKRNHDDQIIGQFTSWACKKPYEQKVEDLNHLQHISVLPPYTYDHMEYYQDKLLMEKCTQMVYCFKCEIIRSERAHHCSTCGYCVQQMDHHCPWTGQCVGRANLRNFLQFLFWTSMALGWMEFINIKFMLFNQHLEEWSMTRVLVLSASSALPFILQCLLIYFFCYVMFNINKNRTYMESQLNYQQFNEIRGFDASKYSFIQKLKLMIGNVTLLEMVFPIALSQKEEYRTI